MWAPEMYALFGVDRDAFEPTWESFLELVHPDDRPAVDGMIARARACGAADFKMVHRIVRPDGEERLVLCRAQVFCGEDGGATRMVGATLDLSDLQGAADESRHRHQHILAAEEIAGMGTFEWRVESDHLTWSEGLCRLFGRDPSGSGGGFADYLSLVHPDDRRAQRGHIESLLRSGEKAVGEYRVLRDDASVRLIRSHIGVIRDAEGTPTAVVGVCRDVTDEELAPPTGS